MHPRTNVPEDDKPPAGSAGDPGMPAEPEEVPKAEEGKARPALLPPEAGMAEWLRRAGAALRQAPLSLPPELEARAWTIVRETLERQPRQRTLRERLAEWVQRPAAALSALGTMEAFLPSRPAVLAAAGPEEAGEESAGTPVIRVVRSDDLRLVATLVITSWGEVWVGFETEDAALAGRTVRFGLREPEAETPAMQGEVTLTPAGPGRWEGRHRLGLLRELPISGQAMLDFAVVEE